MYSFSYLEPVCCSMSSSNCCFLTCIQVSQEAGQVVWCSHLFQNFPQFIVIHTVIGFSVVNEAEADVFLELSCLFYDPTGVGNLISIPLPFLNPACTSGSFQFKYYWHLAWRTEKAMAPHSSTLAWKIPWTEEPGRLQSIGSLRVRNDWATSLSLFIFMYWRRKWQPTPVLLLGKSHGWRSLEDCSPWGRWGLDTTEWLHVALFIIDWLLFISSAAKLYW